MARSRSPQSTPSKIQDRINQLEKLVISLMNTLKTKESESKIESPEPASKFLLGAETRPTNFEAHSQTPLADTFGRISLENAETSYVGSAHWMAILDGVGAFLASL